MPTFDQTSRARPSALTRLREMILRGILKPGERLREMELADRLAMSRTPIRQALPALALEGLLVPAGGRGYAVRAFTRAQSMEALHLRAMLEGYAAQRIVLAGNGATTADALAPIVGEIDRLLSQSVLTYTLEERYGELNGQFHAIVVESADDMLLRDLVARCNVVPFTSPRAVAFQDEQGAEILSRLRYAQRQHHAIVEALRSQNALRVEMLFREHATVQETSILETVRHQTSSGQ